MLTLKRMESGVATVVRAQGEIDEMGISALRVAMKACMSDERQHVVLNLAEVHFLSYTGVGALLEHLGQLRSIQGDLKLAGLNIQGRRLLRTMGLTTVFECYDSEARALQIYKQEAA